MRASSAPDLVFDLVTVFHAAVEYGHALSTDGPNALLTARARFLLHLNPRQREFGTDRNHLLELAYPGMRSESRTPSYFDEVDLWINLNTHLRKTDARNALKTLASAAVLLGGDDASFARGQLLLGSGTWLLWQGMADAQRTQVRPLLPEAFRLWHWKWTKSGIPKKHDAPVHTTMSGLGNLNPEKWRPASLQQQLNEIEAKSRDLLHFGEEAVDLINLPDGTTVPITGLSCKVIVGTTPTICEHADPRIPPTVLHQVPLALDRLLPLPAGLTIHWVGHNAGYRGLCPCHPNAPSAAPVDRERWPLSVMKPVWEAETWRLLLREQPIATYERPAPSQFTVLNAFEDAGWPPEVPTELDGRQLKEAIDSLNDKVKTSPLRFRRAGKKKVGWRSVRPSTTTAENRT